MSNVNSNQLFILIRSLGKAEKRHFKVFSARHVIGKGNIYVQLFDEIAKQKKYDEKAIRAKKVFSDLYSLKKRLYKAILKSLEVYHSGPEMELRSLMDHIHILFDKGLYQQCAKLIQRAKKNAWRFELFEELLQLLRTEARLSSKMADISGGARVLNEEREVYMKLNNQKFYRDLAIKMAERYQRGGVDRTVADRDAMKKLLRKPYLRDEAKALSLLARQSFYNCHFSFSLLTADAGMQYKYSKKMVDMYQQRQDLIAFYPRNWLMAMNNFLIACNSLKYFKEMRSYLYKLEYTRKRLKSVSDSATGFSYLYHLLNYYICLGRFDEAVKDVKRIEAELPEHEPYLNKPQKVVLYALLSQIYFGQKNYKLALARLNRIMASGEMKVRTDIECFVKLFYLVVHYEMKSDRDLMGSLFRSTYRFLYKRERLYKFERAIMDFIKKNLLKDIDRHNIKKQFMKLRAKLVRITEDPLERNLLDYFDFISWLESKIQNRSFAAIIKSKNAP